jgi:hypothetical protein
LNGRAEARGNEWTIEAKWLMKGPNSCKLSSFLAQLNNNSFICNPIEEKIQDLKKKYHVENL